MRQLAYLHIQRKIAARKLRAGTPVSELSIAKELGISRTPTREALRQLITEGLLQEVPGRGAVVVRLTRHDLVELYEMREALECFAVQKVAGQAVAAVEMESLHKLNAEILAFRDELVKSGSEELDAEQMNRFEASDIAFHALLTRLAGNGRCLKALNETRLLIRIFTARRHGLDPSKLEKIHGQHCDILKAVAEGNVERARQAVREQVRGSREERLDEYDYWEREAALKGSVDLVFSGLPELRLAASARSGKATRRQIRAAR
jgi:DNA-binding GntR family transcriptional regulator